MCCRAERSLHLCIAANVGSLRPASHLSTPTTRAGPNGHTLYPTTPTLKRLPSLVLSFEFESLFRGEFEGTSGGGMITQSGVGQWKILWRGRKCRHRTDSCACPTYQPHLPQSPTTFHFIQKMYTYRDFILEEEPVFENIFSAGWGIPHYVMTHQDQLSNPIIDPITIER